MFFVGSQEQRLVKLLKDGSQQAACQFYDLYAGHLAAVCSRYIAGREDQRDVLQDALVHVFSHIADFEYRGTGSLKAWATRVVVNEALKFLRNHHHYDDLPPDDTVAADDGDEPPVADLPPEALHQMVAQLPTGYRTVLNLYVFEGHSHQEIARLLNIRESTSASQLHRAKRLLAQMIRQYTAHPQTPQR